MYSFEGSVFNYFAKEREFIKDVRLEGGWLFLFEFENGAALPPEPLPNSCLTEMHPTTPPKPAVGPTEPPPGLLTAARAAVQLEPQRSFLRWASVVDAAQTAASLRRVRVRSSLRRWFLGTAVLGASRRSAARTAETHRFVRYVLPTACPEPAARAPRARLRMARCRRR